ncbi:hypothetical protein V2J09_012320 [Rumex salicifolius]
MDVPPKEKLELAKKHRFRSLKLLEVDWDQELGNKPFGANHGKLENGLTYYVRCNPKPQKRAALALAVKIGSVVEEEIERGVAHIVEHLAFSATKSYTNHDIVKFLESIGADFGACGNAYTSSDETVYELFVPIDNPELLSKAISILAEFSTEIRISPDDLEKERGAVLEEYRGGRNARGRLSEARWASILEGSKYAERLPIGLEKVIRNVTPDVAHKFYKKWYNLHNMAVVAVGDFTDTQTVIDLIKNHFGHINSTLDFPPIPLNEVPFHEEPRYSCLVESEASGSRVFMSWKIQRHKMVTLRDYKDWLTRCMFLRALNQRFYKRSYQSDPPYFSCSTGEDYLVNPIQGFRISASCREKGAIKALESILLELARVRLHGFSEREISVARALLMSDIESAYAERQRMESSTLRSEYTEVTQLNSFLFSYYFCYILQECYKFCQHFLRNAPMIGVEYEAQLYKTILPKILPSEVTKYAEKFQTMCSCVIMITEPRASVTVDDLKTTVLKTCSLEEKNEVSSWGDDCIPEEIVCVEPNSGNIVQQSEYPDIGITELTLSNGMKVCYKCTDFKNDQIIFEGYSYGGYSELQENDYLSCIKASSIAQEIGKFGHKPSVLVDMLAGKRVEVDTSLQAYTRSFFGDCSPSDLETALQLVYQLFVTKVEEREEHIKIVKQMTKENILAKERDPNTTFWNRVTQLKYGDSYFYKPIKVGDVDKIDATKACQYFNNCFKDPSTFTILIVGNIDPATAHPLILQYLGGIPKPPTPIFQFNRDNLKGVPCNSSSKTNRCLFLRIRYVYIYREVIRIPMVEVQCSVHISFPIKLKSETMREEIDFVEFLTRLLEMKMMQVLRFNHGKIYNVDVSSNLGSNRPSRNEDLVGDISIDFSCDPDASSVLVDIALDEILRLQEHGPSEEDLLSILEIEQRAHENGLQENYYWLYLLLRSYRTRYYKGDVSCTFQDQDKTRSKVREALSPLTMKWALQRILPYPCKQRYTAFILMPQRSFPKFIKTSFDGNEKVCYLHLRYTFY